MDWDRLRRIYMKHGIVLVLGAGVSIGSDLPSWNELLESVADGMEGGDNEDLFRDLRSGGTPLPVIASILQERCLTRTEFVKRVRGALYRDFPFFPAGITEANREELIQHVRVKNPTLRTIASLCAREIGDRTYTTNPLVRAVVTFNLDAVLQEYVRARYNKSLLRTIDRASAQAVTERTNIYHIHGYLRFDRKAGDLAKEAPDAVVLTEQDYFNVFGDPTSLFNYTFLYLLREWSCLFVGLSMQDENIRRLLHVSKQERVRGFENEGRLNPDEIRREAQRHFAILKRSNAPRSDQAVEESLRPLGTSVLWIDDYAEHQSRLREMYEAAGSDWDLVF
jgi:hypothetical protein